MFQPRKSPRADELHPDAAASSDAARLVQLTGTRAGGFVLTRQEAAGKWEKGKGDVFLDAHVIAVQSSWGMGASRP